MRQQQQLSIAGTKHLHLGAEDIMQWATIAGF